MGFTELDVASFTEALASPAPVPGGGGASALIGALGIALGDMVGELTTGKKKYADVEEDIQALMAKAQLIRRRFLLLIDGDAEAFEPLAKAYGIPKDDPDRARIMEGALDVVEEFAAKGSKLAISDAGCGAVSLKAALQAASLNVFINTKAMKNREKAEKLEKEAEEMLSVYTKKADEIYEVVIGRIKG